MTIQFSRVKNSHNAHNWDKAVQVFRKLASSPDGIKIKGLPDDFYQITYRKEFNLIIKKENNRVVFGPLKSNYCSLFQMPEELNYLYDNINPIDKILNEIINYKEESWISKIKKLFKF